MLNVVPAESAIALIGEKINSYDCGRESVNITEATGRILACDIISGEDVPSFSRSTMDGYAVFSRDTFGSGESIPSMLNITHEILMGQKAECKINPGECIRISTGGMLPEGADAVIPVEFTEENTGDICLVYKSVSPFENITIKGDDIRNNQVVLKAGTTLKSTHIAVLASLGIAQVCVMKKPVVAIISTGDELTDINAIPEPGQVRDINSYLLHSMIMNFGCEPKGYGIIADDYNALCGTIKNAACECDVILISGGSSAGARDETAKIIDELGNVFIHGLSMKPGKPTIIGEIDHKPVIGLPGHPAACFFVTEIIVKALLERMYPVENAKPTATYEISENISSNNGREEYLPVKIKNKTATPLYAKSGVISLLCEADGYIRIERDCEGIKKGEPVTVFPL